MYTLISVLILIVCIFLILVVLVQNSKGGGLASNFAGSNQVMGVRRTTDFLEKASWTLAAILLALSILASWAIPKPGEQTQTKIETPIENTNNIDYSKNPAPVNPANLPDENGGAK
jgi:preprotein translocase subunit SecG